MAIKTYQKGSKEKLSANFQVSEFACHGKGCCGIVQVDEQLVTQLQKIRDHFGAPITINSGYRCSTHNKNVGGASGSRHTKGQAADIVVKGVAPAEVAKYAESIGVMGIGLYEGSDGNFVHIDTRPTKSFWYGHKQEMRKTFGGEADNRLELPVLKMGSKGATVKAMQILLIGRKFSCGAYGADGDFGMATDYALRRFQREQGLEATGECDLKTWKKLLGII